MSVEVEEHPPSQEEHSLLSDVDSELPPRWHFIDVHMLPCKLLYFFGDGMYDTYVFYIVVFLVSLGLDVKEAGFVSGIQLLSSSLAAPIWGYLADYTGRRKTIFVTILVGTLAAITPMPWIGRALNSAELNRTNFRNSSSLNHTEKGCVANVRQPFANQLFYCMLGIALFASIFINSMSGIIDSFVTKVVQLSPTKTTYGKQRWAGSVGFALTSLLAGLASDYYNNPRMSPYTAIFIIFAFCGVLLLPAGLVVASQAKWEPSQDTGMNKGSQATLLLSTLQNIDNCLFICSVFVIGVAATINAAYLFQLIESKLHASQTCLALGNVVSGLVEVLIFPIAHKVMKLVGGTIPSIELAILSWAVRFILISFIRNPWLLLPIQTLNCFSYSLFWAAAVEHTQTITHKDIYFTMYTIVATMYYSMGGVVGYFLGGIVFSKYSGSILFRATGIFCASWVGFTGIYFHGIVGLRRSGERTRLMEMK